MSDLTNKCIWITGATSGIGLAVAERLADLGNFVIATGRNKEVLAALEQKHQGRIAALPADLSAQGDSIEALQKALKAKTDYCDILLCCAGVAEYEDELTFDVDMYRRVFDVNFFAVVRTLKAALPLLKKSEGRAQFAAVGSLSSLIGFPRAEAYGASKAALDYFMASLKADLVNLPIDTTIIRPGFVKTALTDRNDFDMPFIVGVDRAAEDIVDGLAKRKETIEFPRRLSWTIRGMAKAKLLWYKLIAPKMTRISQADW